MERTKQKSKKEKPNKYVDKEKPTSFVADMKTMKENLKIREILRNVKMNSSMRIKAPRGSKVMQNNDLNDNQDIFEDFGDEEQELSDPLSTTNSLVVNSNVELSDKSEDNSCAQDEVHSNASEVNLSREDYISDNADNFYKSCSLSEGLHEPSVDYQSASDLTQVPQTLQVPYLSPTNMRDRKLSLDHTILSKRDSVSEMDLHLMGKSPLEKKASFFKKKMDSFLKNTTEIFKKQSLERKSSIQRKSSICSRLSISMQSLYENEPYIEQNDPEASDKYNKEERGSVLSLRSTLHSGSSASVAQSDRFQPDNSEDGIAGAKSRQVGNQMFGGSPAISVTNLSDTFAQDSLLNSRAISMSSGLDTATNPRRRKASRANRTTWLASDIEKNYFRRLTQDEKSKEKQVGQSYQEFSTISEYSSKSPRTDSKGRRLSYQRAVSGEDPVLPSRYQDSVLRNKNISEIQEATNELTNCLARYAQKGIPTLLGYKIRQIPEQALSYLQWAEDEKNLEEHFDWKSLSQIEESRQAVIKEFIYTEADHIRHLNILIELYIRVAHALQDNNKLLAIDTSRLFLNIPDVLNASVLFWEKVIYPMIHDSFENQTHFNSDLMAPGFADCANILEPYEFYVCNQTKAVDYLRSLTSNGEFMTYLTWCNSRNNSSRLQLADILVKPMQRLTKYSVILNRIIAYTESAPSKLILESMVKSVNSFVQGVNRAIRQKEEIEKLEELDKMIESYDVDCKDEDMERYFRLLNETSLKCPMANCDPNMYRNVIYQADMRFKECNMKEVDVRAIILTDMILICKKVVKGSCVIYKMIRPKYTVDSLVPFARNKGSGTYDMNGIIFVALNDHNTAYTVFCLSETSKDSDPQHTYKIWDEKFREAKISYELCMWFNKYRVKDLAEVEMDHHPDEFKREFPNNLAIEKKARERVAAMMHPNNRPQETTSSDVDERLNGEGPAILLALLTSIPLVNSLRTSRLSSLHNTQSTSSRNSRISSFQQSSATSHEEPYAHRPGSSFEHLASNFDGAGQSSQSPMMLSATKSEFFVNSRQTPVLILQHSSPHHSAEPRSASAGGSKNTLRVSPQHSMGHSMPDLSIEPSSSKPPSPFPMTASEKLYQSHQELLQRNRLAATQYQHQYLTPDHRGSSYPPPSSTRASLKRGLAFSYSCKNPPLAKMGHVNSQSQIQNDPTTTQIKVPQDIFPSTSSDKGDKKKQVMRMNKSDGTNKPSSSDKA